MAAWFCISIVFFSLGAWPISGFFGLDVLGLYIAFRWNYRAARVQEEISLSRTSLQIRKIGMTGRVEEHSFNPFWARFDVKRHEEIGVTEMVVETREQRVLVGEFLNPNDREDFATAFSRALSATKRA